MACLLITHDVICIWDDRSLKIKLVPSHSPLEPCLLFHSFPAHGFPLDISYKPPQVAKAAHIAKITSCDDLFAALSSNGELFTFSVPINDAAQGKGIKPQRVWALRKQFSAVKVCVFFVLLNCMPDGFLSRTWRSVQRVPSSFAPSLGMYLFGRGHRTPRLQPSFSASPTFSVRLPFVPTVLVPLAH